MEGRLEAAGRLLEEARTTCTDKSSVYLERVAQLIADKREQLNRLGAEKSRDENELEQRPLDRFLGWVASTRSSLGQDIVGIDCVARGQADYGFCGGHYPSAPQMRARFWQLDRDAFRYTFDTKLPISCQALGRNRPVRRWTTGATDYELCELESHKLRSLTALIQHSEGNSRLHVYSHAYPQRDASFQRLIATPE